MEATAFTSLTLHHPKLRKPISSLLSGMTLPCIMQSQSLNLEYGCRTSSFSSWNMQSFQSINSSLGAYVNRVNVLRRVFEDDNCGIHRSSDSKKNRDRLIALFKRIQTSISQEESESRDNKSYLLSDDDSTAQTSVQEFQQQSSINNVSSYTESSEQSIRRTSDKQKSVSISEQPPELKVKRAPSNFVKKSPIPLPSPLRSNDLELTEGGLSSSEAQVEPVQLEEMKLSELKGLAKERGVRGYSKLKKSELIKLLMLQIKV